MSKFSDSLNEIIKEYEPLNIYNIAKEIGCDRSWLQKVVSGDRKMNFEFIQPLCELLQNHLDPAEISELYEQFAEDYFGNDRYTIVQYIKRRFNEMGQREPHMNRYMDAEFFDVEDYIKTFMVPERIQDLIRKLHHMIVKELEDAEQQNRKPILYLYVPSFWRHFRVLLLIMCNRNEIYKNLDFKCAFSGNMELQNKEIAQLEDFISAYGLAVYNLNVFDIMDNKGQHVALDLLPYYAITKNQIFLISEDGGMYVEISDPKTINKMTAKYLAAVKEKSLFAGKLDESIYLNRLTSMKIGNEKSYVIGNHMCIEAFLGKDDMQEFIGNHMNYPDLALTTAIQFYQNMQTSDLNMVFSSETMFEMVPADEDDIEMFKKRLQTWEMLYEHYMQHPEKQIHIFDSKRYRFSERIHLNLLVEKAIVALNYEEEDKTLFEKNMAVLMLPKVVECFKDFFDYFTNSNICMNREHTLRMMKMCIDTKRQEVCDGIVEK